MIPEILTPQEHRPRSQQKPSTMILKDGRMITIFPNGDTQTLLTDGTKLLTSKHYQGTWVKKPCGDTEYIPPLDKFTQEFLDEKMKARVERRDAEWRRKDDKQDPFWDIRLNDQIMERGTYT